MSRIYVGQDLESLAGLKNYQAWILDHFRPHLHGRGLEIGAGSGAFSALLLPHLTGLDLLEPADNLIAGLQARFAGVGSVRVVHGGVEGFLPQVAPETYDTVVMINVLEHLREDAQALTWCRTVLKPGGALLLFVPAMPFLFSDMDRHLGHFRRYTRVQVERLLEGAGLEILEVRCFDLLGILPWWVVNTLLGRTAFNPVLVGWYDRLGIPLTRRVESRVVPPVGKNVIAVARKGG